MGKAVALIYPTHGHIAPALGVVSELVACGESVIFYGTGRSQQKIGGTGAEYRSYVRGHDEFNPNPPTEGLFSDMSRLSELTAGLLPGLLAELKILAPDYLLVDTKSLWGRLAGQILKIPTITLSVVFAIQPESIAVRELTPLLYKGASEERLRRALRELTGYVETSKKTDRRYGTTSPGIVEYLGNPQPMNIIFTSREFQLRGNSFGDHYHFVGPSILPERERADGFPMEWFRPDLPLIYISLGTTYYGTPEFYRACLDAWAGLPVQVVLSTGPEGVKKIGEAPANFLIRESVPQIPILRRASVFVTHGGMNSANEAMFCGVPMVVVPQAGDQHLVAMRVVELGAGLAIPPGPIAAERLRETVGRVLEGSGFRQKSQELAISMKEAGGFRRAARLILEHVASDATTQNERVEEPAVV